MATGNSDSEIGNPLPPHGLLFPNSSNGVVLGIFYIHHPTYRITPAVELWVEKEGNSYLTYFCLSHIIFKWDVTLVVFFVLVFLLLFLLFFLFLFVVCVFVWCCVILFFVVFYFILFFNLFLGGCFVFSCFVCLCVCFCLFLFLFCLIVCGFSLLLLFFGGLGSFFAVVCPCVCVREGVKINICVKVKTVYILRRLSTF